VMRQDPQLRQNNAYRDAIRNLTGKTRWLALIDLDEFILPRHQDDIRETLREYEEYNGLAINWAIYGSNGHVTRPPNQINHFLHRSTTNWGPNRFVKSIVKPDRVLVDTPYHVHFSQTREGVTVNENHETVTWMCHAVSTEKIRINHYIIRSWQDYWETKATRPRFNNLPPRDEACFEYNDRNEIFDNEIAIRFGHVIGTLR